MTRFRRILVLALGLGALAGMAAYVWRIPARPPLPSPSTAATFRVDLATQPSRPAAGQPVSLAFAIHDGAGKLVTNLAIVHERPIHLIVVSSDLAYFAHIHPEPRPDGTFVVENVFPAGGSYDLYAQYTPLGGIDQIAHLHCDVDGAERAPETLAVADGPQTARSVRVALQTDGPLRSGVPLKLRFSIADVKTGKPVLDLEPYLGALAHIVAISEDRTEFLHVHPNEDPTSFPDITARAVFPKAGLYKLWAQFQRAGEVEVAAYVLKVEEGPHDDTAVVAQLVDGVQEASVTVSSRGYEPSRIGLKRGVPARITFVRTDADNCGDEVVLREQNLRKQLPVGVPVAVEFTPESDGEITFTCGMGMYRGTFTVSSQ